MRRTNSRRAFRLAMFRRRAFWIGTIAWFAFFVFPIVPGLLAREIFDELGEHGASVRLWVLLVAVLGAELVMTALIAVGNVVYVRAWNSAVSVAQANVLDAQLASGGPTAGPRVVSSGDAVSRFKDDTHDLVIFADNVVDLLGGIAFGSVALLLLARIDAVAAVVALGPLVVVTIVNQVLSNQLRLARTRSRAATSGVTGFLGAVLSAALTVKVAGAQRTVLHRLRELNAVRGRHAVRDQVLGDAAFTVNDAVIDLCLGLALLVTVSRARSGALDAGDVALFAVYFTDLAWLPRRVGWWMVGRRRFQVSAGRLDALLPPGTDRHDPLTHHRPLPILGGPPAVRTPPAARRPLECLELRGLEVAERGLGPVDLVVPRGSLTVVSGAVGSGKTTLLRAVLGLSPLTGGEVRWNGEVIEDRAAFFVPPQSAYVPQVPRLVADTLHANLVLGEDVSPAELDEAVRLAVFEDDTAGLGAGLATLIGARGVRLSGGQAQRAAAARALVRRPELLVLDDLTSALDVETELALWDRLAAEGFTVLAVSNRPVALARADQVLELRPVGA